MRPEQAIRELEALRREADDPQIRRPTAEHRAWKAKVKAVLARSLGDAAPVLREFRDLRYHVGVWTGAPGEAEQDARYFAERLDDANALIGVAIYELSLPANAEQLTDQDIGSHLIKGLEQFVDDDTGYLRWLSDHPGGFVLNTGRKPTVSYLMLHRSDCHTISGRPARGATFTGEYSKVCGTRESLEAFASSLGGSPDICRACIGSASSGGKVSKYGPLRDHLAAISGSETRMTFTEVEELVGQLPKSARSHRAFWSNSSNMARAWRDAGWQVRSVNQAAGEVIFARGAPPSSAPATHDTPRRSVPYVDVQVMNALGGADRADRADRFDWAKLLRLIAELNDNHDRGNAYAAHMLLRAILDHIPPLLNCADFKEVANNHAWSRTDKAYMRKLLDFKLQADDVLHRQISAKPDLLAVEDMPPRTWVNRLLQECAT